MKEIDFTTKHIIEFLNLKINLLTIAETLLYQALKEYMVNGEVFLKVDKE